MKSNSAQERRPKNKACPPMRDCRRALELALWYLSRQAQSEKQIRDKLSRKEFEGEEIDEAIKKLKDLGFVNDQKFAQDFVRQSKLGKPKGKHRLRLELIKKGIDKEIITEVLETGFSEGEQEELIDSAAKAYLKKIKNLPREKAYQRLMGYLLRRGFDYEKVSKAVKLLLKDRV